MIMELSRLKKIFPDLRGIYSTVCLPLAGSDYEGAENCVVTGWGLDENRKLAQKMKQVNRHLDLNKADRYKSCTSDAISHFAKKN